MIGDMLADAGILLAQGLSAATGQSTNLPSDAPLLSVNLMEMMRTSDLVGKVCVAILLIFSIVSWAVILLKFVHIRLASNQTREFLEKCMAGATSLDEAYKNAANYPDSPVSQLLREAYLELEMENWYREGYDDVSGGRLELARLGVERVLERTIATEIDYLESYLIFLATTSNACPFIGLFGTVWGIMAVFQTIGIQGSTGLGAMAPGLATALLTTIVGLVAAIPASVMYNYLTNRVRILTSRMDSFALELTNIIQKQLARG